MNQGSKQDEAFEQLLNRFGHFIRAHICKFDLQRYGIDPDDITQDVRIKIWKLLHSEKSITNYASYIKKIVDSSVIDQLRKFRREEGLYDLEKRKKVAEHELLYNLEMARFKSLEDVVGKAVETLIHSRRQVVKLYLLNLSISEISSYLNWSVDKTRNLLYRGLSDLKKQLSNAETKNGNK